VVLNWTPTELTYVLSGLYRLTASLLTPSGINWTEQFYLRATAPYSVLAAFPLILIILLIYELYSVAISGRYSGAKPKSGPSPVSSLAATTPPAATTPAPGTEPPTPPASPPSGGSP
jgi:hypothetical protein